MAGIKVKSVSVSRLVTTLSIPLSVVENEISDIEMFDHYSAPRSRKPVYDETEDQQEEAACVAFF